MRVFTWRFSGEGLFGHGSQFEYTSEMKCWDTGVKKHLERAGVRSLFLVVPLMLVQPILGQGIPVSTDLPQLGPNPIMALSGNNLRASFGSTGLWLPTIHFPASANAPASDLQIDGPIDSVYVGLGESITYGGSFTLSDGQKQMLLTGQAQLVLTQDEFSIDPSFVQQVVTGSLSVTSVIAPIAPPKVVRPGNIRLNWQSIVGQAYMVQFKALANAPAWTDTGITIIATATSSTMDVTMLGGAGFYRVIQVQ